MCFKKKNVISLEILNTLLFSRCQYLLVSCSPYFIYFIYNIVFLTSLSIHTIVYFKISSIFCHKYICSPIVIGHKAELKLFFLRIIDLINYAII